jgi:hypothetical protein
MEGFLFVAVNVGTWMLDLPGHDNLGTRKALDN